MRAEREGKAWRQQKTVHAGAAQVANHMRYDEGTNVWGFCSAAAAVA